MIQKLMGHLVTLPRWFGVVAAVTSVTLGGIIAGASAWYLFLAVMAGVFLMAYAHSWNAFHDWAITGFDKGTPTERSKKKVYTSGQSLLALGMLSQNEVLANSLGWLILSLGFAIPLSLMTTMWVWLPFGLVVLCAPWYSEAKRLWHPEIPLGLGFATFAIWLGQAAAGKPDFVLGALVSIPLFLMWGVFAEHIDQARDYEENWPKHGRSLGMLVRHYNIPLRWSIAWIMSVIFLAQIFLIAIGILAPWTGLTFLSVIPMTACAILLDTPASYSKGVLWGLGGIFLYQILLVVGQALGG